MNDQMHFEHMKDDLESLGREVGVFERTRQADLFQEFLREREFGLALHVLCDFLLEAGTGPIKKNDIRRIQELHQKMGIEDECVAQLDKRS